MNKKEILTEKIKVLLKLDIKKNNSKEIFKESKITDKKLIKK